MRIQTVQVRGFKSVGSAELLRCGGMNVLIGKNNAGKSNLLSAIELVLNSLKRGGLSGPWLTQRPTDEFSNRDQNKPLEVGIEFTFPSAINGRLCSELSSDFPQLAKSTEQIGLIGSIVFIVAAAILDRTPVTYVKQIGLGKLVGDGQGLGIAGLNLMTVTQPVALELSKKYQEVTAILRDISALEEIVSDRRPLDRAFQPPKDDLPRFVYTGAALRARRDVQRDAERMYASAKSAEDFVTAVMEHSAKLRQQTAEISKKEIAGVLKTFGGDAKSSPEHIRWLMEEYGAIPVMHFLENKQSLGREEAEKLLQLKNRRGGPQQLNALQQTIKGLLGVHIDAFKESDQAPAEMDVDQFLVEANGAGVREALRIVLDLELRGPKLVLIEEPEVHLHPGLARVVANYLRQKSAEIQMFVTTHSTEFVDSVAFQNAYLVSRDSSGMTTCQLVEAEEEALRIPTELGLRLSTVFMFDRLVFVEGPSDEAVLRILAEKLEIDLASCNLGFVHMGGVRNFAHFAAQSTLDLLSRRQVSMWFVTDRDESEDEEVQRMRVRLGSRAHLRVLGRRELENYLWDEGALAKFITQKLQSSETKGAGEPDRGAIRTAIEKAVAESKEDVVRLRVAKRSLRPLYFGGKGVGTAKEKLGKGADEVNARLSGLDKLQADIEAEVDALWATDAPKLAPGAIVLDRVTREFGARFLKENGDSEKLARLIPPSAIPQEVEELLREFST
jgi:putative ATP-dependent endonuclease of OLD family